MKLCLVKLMKIINNKAILYLPSNPIIHTLFTFSRAVPRIYWKPKEIDDNIRELLSESKKIIEKKREEIA